MICYELFVLLGLPGNGCMSAALKLPGARAFGVVAPTVWNELTDSIRSSDSNTLFKTNLKT